MSTPRALHYPETERLELEQMTGLHHRWQEAIGRVNPSLRDLYVTDGFYPHYFSRKVRVLFIGREARGLAEHNYLEVLWKAYTDTKSVGGVGLNRCKFHRLLLYVTYALTHAQFDYAKIPYATELGDTFGTPEGLSFAFGNLSKLSNETGEWTTQWDLLQKSQSASSEGRGFHREFVSLLRPHIVIAMNLPDRLGLFGEVTELKCYEHAEAYDLSYGNGRALLVNMFHFSAWGKRDATIYIEPLREIAAAHLGEYCEAWNSVRSVRI